MRKTLKRRISIVLEFALILILFVLPVSAASNFSYSYEDTPLMTPFWRELIAKHDAASPNDDVLVGLLPNYAGMWVDGHTWEEIEVAAKTSDAKERFLAVDEGTEVLFYRHQFVSPVKDEPRTIISKRLFSMKDGYRYGEKTYDIEMIYWFDGVASNTGGGYAAIVTTEGTFFEHYNQIYAKKEDAEVLVFTEEEFAQWYPEFVRPAVELNRYNHQMGYLGGGVDLGSFADFLAANGFTPRYGEAQGVTRRVLTYGGIGLASVALVGGITYATVRNRRKRKAAAEGDEIL